MGDRDKIELLNTNLQQITHSTYSAEAAYLGWEAVYALIEGQLIIAYFTKNNQSNSYDKFMMFFGAILALSWLILMIINNAHQEYRSKAIRNIESRLGQEYSKTAAIWFWSEDIKMIGGLVSSTWVYRKIVPAVISIYVPKELCHLSTKIDDP